MKNFCCMGRIGDLVIVLPAFKKIFDDTGGRVRLFTSEKFGGVMDGVSYVDTVKLPVDSERLAVPWFQTRGITPRYLRWWETGQEDDWKDLPIGGNDQSVIYQGKQWVVNFSRWPNYQTSLWDRTGVPIELMRTLPLVFDRRDADREAELVKTVQNRNRKKLPLLLCNFNGHSSKFPATPEVMNELDKWAGKLFLVNLGDFQCERIYDLLGLMDAAKVLVTIDTATLHLAAASKIPVMAFTNEGWSSSVPKGNVKLNLKYKNAVKGLANVNHFISSILNTP